MISDVTKVGYESHSCLACMASQVSGLPCMLCQLWDGLAQCRSFWAT